jgi:hypothetical protein
LASPLALRDFQVYHLHICHFRHGYNRPRTCQAAQTWAECSDYAGLLGSANPQNAALRLESEQSLPIKKPVGAAEQLEMEQTDYSDHSPILKKGTDAMTTRKRLILGMLASILFAQACWAQIPAAPPPPPIPGAPAVTTTSPPNLWSYLCPNADQKAACKACFCASPIGQMISGAAGPMSMYSGGLIKNCCALNAIQMDLAKDATSSEGAAARIKKDEAEAKARRAAVRYLGTVDCNYWPEAIEALSLSLRKDPNECVRFEAALALRNGCCCQEKTIKALTHCVEGSDKDGAPKERSDRVRAAATDALARCPMLMKEQEDKRDDELKKVQATNVKDYYARVTPADREQIVASARGVLASLNAMNNANHNSPAASSIAPIQQRPSSLSGIVAHAFSADAPAAGSRQPFFTNLTSTLKGRQEDMIANRREPTILISPAPVIATPTPLPPGPSEIKPTVSTEIAPPTLPVNFRPAAAPTPVRESVPVTIPIPIPIPTNDTKTGMLIEVVSPTPINSGAQLGQPTTKTEPSVEIIQPRPTATRPVATSPRQTRGVVAIEVESAVPQVVTPSAPR